MRENVYRCDVCGVAKQESNHWFLASQHGAHGPTWSISTWTEVDARQDDVTHLCGQECAVKKLTEFMSGAK